MELLLCHLIGDYLFQSSWMATNKKKPSLKGELACHVHCFLYTLVFLSITTNFNELFWIYAMHYIIDRTKIVDWMIAIRDQCIYKGYDLSNLGLPLERPKFIAFFVYVMCDNTLHLLFNFIILN